MLYQNPVLRGFNPDPSICRVGEDYYLVTSSFSYFPGLPVYHSTDLVNWRQIGNAIDRPGQLPMERAAASGGVWAPTLRYENGWLYIVSTFSECGNFIIRSRQPGTGWSEPVFLPMGGIDPSLLFEDGQAYLCTNFCAEPGREAISLAQIDPVTGALLRGPQVLWGGTGGGFLEGPHLYRIGGWYYLLAAEGGTGLTHMATIARSRALWGPYESCPHNPILTNRNDTSKQVACSGHGDLFADCDGNWWMVHLATRPANNWLSHLGRETFLLPVVWEDGWPRVADGKSHLRWDGPVRAAQERSIRWQAHFTAGKPLEPCWMALRCPQPESYRVMDNALSLTPSAVPLSGETGSPAMLLLRQADLCCRFTVQMEFDPLVDGSEAGVVLYLSNRYYYCFAKRRRQGQNYIVVEKRADDFCQTLCAVEVPSGPLTLQIDAAKLEDTFVYRVGEGELQQVGKASTRFLSCELAGKCFTGVLNGIYAVRGRAPQSTPENPAVFTQVSICAPGEPAQ